MDIRNHCSAYLTIDARRGSLTALAIHSHAPIIASGSAKKTFRRPLQTLGFLVSPFEDHRRRSQTDKQKPIPLAPSSPDSVADTETHCPRARSETFIG
ncbi:Regulatory-associated protein of TOR [Asimina triloba]